jgi:ribokinase
VEQRWDVVVVGSANLDVVLRVAAVPAPGETVLASGRSLGPGGKGANQAVAAARSGARTALVACLGDDDGAAVLRAGLADAGVDLSLVRTSPSGTGTAYVVVDDVGENAIVVDAAGNADLRVLHDPDRAALGAATVVLAQLEVPVEVVTEAATAARGLVVLNAAPARALPDALLDAVDVLVVNEHEAGVVAGSPRGLEAAVERLLERVPEVVVTLGAAGALLADRDGSRRLPGLPAREVVDTTGAGDVFCGALAAARARGSSTLDAARLAQAAASLSVERAGAARSTPTLAEAEARLTAAGGGG